MIKLFILPVVFCCKHGWTVVDCEHGCEHGGRVHGFWGHGGDVISTGVDGDVVGIVTSGMVVLSGWSIGVEVDVSSVVIIK